MPSNTIFNPQNENSYEKSMQQKFAEGVQANITEVGSTTVDLVLTDDSLMHGAFLLVNKPYQGDYAEFSVIGPEGSGYTSTFVDKWYLDPESIVQPVPERSKFPAKIPAGFTIRLTYHAQGPDTSGTLNTSIWMAINYDKDKVLV